MNTYLNLRVILLQCQYSEILSSFQNVSNPDLYFSRAEVFSSSSWGHNHPSTLVVTDSTMAARWIPALILETFDLPVLVAPTPSLLLILTCLIFLFTGDVVLAIHSDEEWHSIHIHNVNSMNGTLHRGMRLKCLFHRLKICGKDSRNVRNNVKIRETYEAME